MTQSIFSDGTNFTYEAKLRRRNKSLPHIPSPPFSGDNEQIYITYADPSTFTNVNKEQEYESIYNKSKKSEKDIEPPFSPSAESVSSVISLSNELKKYSNSSPRASVSSNVKENENIYDKKTDSLDDYDVQSPISLPGQSATSKSSLSSEKLRHSIDGSGSPKPTVKEYGSLYEKQSKSPWENDVETPDSLSAESVHSKSSLSSNKSRRSNKSPKPKVKEYGSLYEKQSKSPWENDVETPDSLSAESVHSKSSLSRRSNKSPKPKVKEYESFYDRKSKSSEKNDVKKPESLSGESASSKTSLSSDKLRYSRHSSRSPNPSPNNSGKKEEEEITSGKSNNSKKLRRRLSLPTLSKTNSPTSPKNNSATLSVNKSPTPSRKHSIVSLSDSGTARVLSHSKEIILRQIYKDGTWYDHRDQTTSFNKSDGTVFKKSKTTESEITTNEDDVEQEETLDDLEESFIKHIAEREKPSRLFSRHGRGLIQDDQEIFCKEAIAKINIHREKHRSKPLRISETLCYLARDWAKYLNHSGKTRFANRHDVGESISIRILTEPFAQIDGENIIDKWYSEIELHDYNNYADILAANFTQMVWQSTKEVGCAIQRSLDGKTSYIVVFYYPKGNFPGEHIKQVPPVGGFNYKARNEKGIIQPHIAEKDDSFMTGIMRAINYYRLQHGAISLTLDKSLTDYANEWANKLAAEDKIRSRPKNVYGENIYRSTIRTSSDIPGQEPVEYWYKKKKYYKFAKPGDIRAAPFTQLVWQDSRDIGVGFAKSASERLYVVANFNPPGNLIGQFEKQVLPIKWK